MATTRESLRDGLDWVAGLVRIGLRRALILAIFVGLFAAAVLITTRENFSDCGDVTDQQRELLDGLRAETQYPFRAADAARCVEGEYSASIEGLSSEMEEASRQLVGAGFSQETEYVAYGLQVWRRCFSHDDEGWEQAHVIIDATRGGNVFGTKVTALEDARGCDPERRDVSTIYPPRT